MGMAENPPSPVMNPPAAPRMIVVRATLATASSVVRPLVRAASASSTADVNGP
jgi:hypothetical protein